jgi:hypothetical protein
MSDNSDEQPAAIELRGCLYSPCLPSTPAMPKQPSSPVQLMLAHPQCASTSYVTYMPSKSLRESVSKGTICYPLWFPASRQMLG